GGVLVQQIEVALVDGRPQRFANSNRSDELPAALPHEREAALLQGAEKTQLGIELLFEELAVAGAEPGLAEEQHGAHDADHDQHHGHEELDAETCGRYRRHDASTRREIDSERAPGSEVDRSFVHLLFADPGAQDVLARRKPLEAIAAVGVRL